MALKLIGTILGNSERQKGRVVRIYRDTEWNEFRARLFIEGKLYEPADYHTDDRDDAWSAGMMMVEPSIR
jgi:L-rhamnose isomerase